MPAHVGAGAQTTPSSENQNEYAPIIPEELDSLVAPIALYPDALVAQVLGAATFPEQVTDANGWLKQDSRLTGEPLMRAVEKESWGPAVEALTQFPSVLDDLAKNLAWTSALGEAAATVFEKDYGDKTADVAKAMTEFNPDGTWAPVGSLAQN
jgi:hypothetical protein